MMYVLHVGGAHVALQVWDVGGQTSSPMLKNYIYGAQVRHGVCTLHVSRFAIIDPRNIS